MKQGECICPLSWRVNTAALYICDGNYSERGVGVQAVEGGSYIPSPPLAGSVTIHAKTTVHSFLGHKGFEGDLSLSVGRRSTCFYIHHPEVEYSCSILLLLFLGWGGRYSNGEPICKIPLTHVHMIFSKVWTTGLTEC